MKQQQRDAVVIQGREAVNVFACAAVAAALRTYAHTRIQVNRRYTPTNMLNFAKRHTGRTFPRTPAGYLAASQALTEHARSAVNLVPVQQQQAQG